MAQDNQVVIVGNLTRDPELRYTPNGAALVKFGVAVSRSSVVRNSGPRARSNGR